MCVWAGRVSTPRATGGIIYGVERGTVAMSVALMVQACSSAELDLLEEEWAKDRLTRGVWVVLRVVSAVLTVLLIIPNLVISIPRALLAFVPIVNLAYLLLIQSVYMVLFGPVWGTSWAWREVPPPMRLVIRPLLVPIGVPFAILGSVWIQLSLPGGPGEHGANKAYKASLFESWPLTIGMESRVWQTYPYEL